jgi:hypothetical protein
MEKEFVPYELALRMKQLGFDEPCLGFYNKEDRPNLGYCTNSFQDDTTLEIKCTAPLYQQAFRWLLDKHYLYGIVLPTLTMNWTFKTMTVVEGMVEVPPYIHVDTNDYSTREDAELACLEKLIEIVEQKNEN